MIGIGGDRYAIPARDIVEIAPSIAGTSVPGTSRAIAGLIQYRDRAIPLLDLGELCRGTACTRASTTRILIVRADGLRGDLLGIRAEGVASCVRMDDGVFQAPGVAAAPYITGVALSGGAIVQWLDLHRLLDANAVELFAPESPSG